MKRVPTEKIRASLILANLAVSDGTGMREQGDFCRRGGEKRSRRRSLPPAM